VALVIHLPATPFAQIVGLMSALFDITSDDRHDYDAGVVMIAVELTELPPAPKPREENLNPLVMDAPPANDDEVSKAIKLPAGAPPEPPKPDPEAAASARPTPKPPAHVPEALGLAGEVSRAVEGKANVTISLWLDGITDKPVGEALTPLLTCGALGRTFDLAGIQPSKDLRAVLFAGPKLHDTSEYVTAVDHHMDPDKLRDAFDRLVHRPNRKGQWLDESAAKFWAFGAERVGFPHSPSLAFITPAQGWQDIRQHQRTLALPPSRGRALSFGLLEPSIPLKKLGFRLPPSLREMRLDLYLSSTGVTTVRLVFEDASEDEAQKHVRTVSTQLEDFLWRVNQLNAWSRALGPAGPRSDALPFEMPPLVVVAEGARILGAMEVPEVASRALLSKMVLLTCPPKVKAPETETEPSTKHVEAPVVSEPMAREAPPPSAEPSDQDAGPSTNTLAGE
jgi:hypothetical protein